MFSLWVPFHQNQAQSYPKIKAAAKELNVIVRTGNMQSKKYHIQLDEARA
jgi:hypothetical protein